MIDYSEYITERTKEFTGREWVFQVLSDWLGKPGAERRFLLTGGPGSGKTALAARLVQMSQGYVSAQGYPFLGRDSLACFHFCQALMDTTLNPQRFVERLSMSLADRFEPFRLALHQVIERSSNTSIQASVTQNIDTVEGGAQVAGIRLQVRVGDVSARSAFDLLVRRPLQMIYKDGFQEQVVILVDSLDEALTFNPNDNILSLLSLTTDLPINVRWLLTSRPDDQVFSLIDEKPLDLIADAPQGSEDVRLYVFNRLALLSEPRRSVFADRVALEARGNFLYTRYVLDDLLPEIEGVVDLETLPLPKNLRDQYRLFLRRELARNLKDWLKDYAPIFGVMAAARGQGLSLAQLAGITQRPTSETSLLLAACDQYLVGSQPKGPFRIYHQSFRDFLLENQTYPIFPAEAEVRVAEFFLKRYANAWHACKDDYALQFAPSHLAEAARLDAEYRSHEFTEKLVRLVMDSNYQEAYADQFADPIALQRSLELALQVASVDQDPGGLGLVIETALGLDAYRRENLQPEPIFELARQGHVRQAENRLALFGIESRWRSMVLLTIAWLAVRQNPAAAQVLFDQTRSLISESPQLELLVGRVDAALNKIDFPDTLLPPLPPDPGPEPVREIVNRMGGGEYNPSFLMEFGAELNVQQYEMLLESDEMSSSTEEDPAYIGEREGPLLVAYVVSHPQDGNRVLRDYLAIHALNNYVLYRNRSLWGLLGALLMHPDQDWVRSTLPEIAEAALTGNRLVFSEPLNISLSAVKGEPSSRQALDQRASKALEAADLLMLQLGGPDEKGDAWGSHARRLASLAEAYNLVFNDPVRSAEILDRALELPHGFAGFRAPLCLTLAESLRICGHDEGRVARVLHAGFKAAHNITDPIFCVRTTARLNAVQNRYWVSPDPVFNVEQAVKDFLHGQQGRLQAAVHIIGDNYAERKVAVPVSLPLPALFYNAKTLAQLSRIYQQPLAEFQRLNPDWDSDQVLPPDTQVNVPDPEFAPLAASRLAAEALSSKPLSQPERTGILKSLVPSATSDQTVLYNLLGRMLLSAGFIDPQTLARLSEMIPNLE